MRDARVPRSFCRTALILAALAATPRLARAAGDDREAFFQQRRAEAQAALEMRMKARVTAGWSPKSQDEQLVMRLRRLKDSRIRSQELANTRASFEAARAEVYMELVRHYTKIGYYRRGYTYGYVQDRATGIIRPVRWSHDYWVLDPWAAQLSAHFGNKAARSKGIAAAQEYHANTYYERQIHNTSTRIAALQKQISLKSQLARQAP